MLQAYYGHPTPQQRHVTESEAPPLGSHLAQRACEESCDKSAAFSAILHATLHAILHATLHATLHAFLHATLHAICMNRQEPISLGHSIQPDAGKGRGGCSPEGGLHALR